MFILSISLCSLLRLLEIRAHNLSPNISCVLSQTGLFCEPPSSWQSSRNVPVQVRLFGRASEEGAQPGGWGSSAGF